MTLSCEMGGCQNLVSHVQEKYGVDWDKANEEGTLSLQGFQCLGSCHTAPVILLNDERHEGISPDALDKLLADAGVGGAATEADAPPAAPEAETTDEGGEANA